MSPRRGGESDKFGGRYEGRWTARQLLYVLRGEIDSVTVEDVGEVGEGAEFTVKRGNTVEVHQVKRQHGNANEWTLATLNSNGVLRSARQHVAAGREFHFISTVPFRILQKLADRAYRSGTLQQFIDHWLTDKLRPIFNHLSGDNIYGTPQVAWETLCGMKVRCIDEQDMVDVNSALAGVVLEGAAPALAAVGIGNLAGDNLGVELNSHTIERLLEKYRLTLAHFSGNQTIRKTVTSVTENWKARIERELLKPVISRTQSSRIADTLTQDRCILLAVGAAGDGKTGVLYESLTKIEAQGWDVLAFRLDRIEPFSSTEELGKQLRLNISPVSALAAISGDKPCLLIVDQLDAVSLSSGRMPETFDAVADLLREAQAFPVMRVVLACRKFDMDNDHRIRAIAQDERVTQVEIGPLDDQQVDAAVQSMHLASPSLTPQQRKLLGSPLHLVLLSTIADQVEALRFSSSRDLLDAYWERKRRDCRARRQPPVRFSDVIRVLAEAMSAQQRLAAPISVLDSDNLLDDADVLASEHVLVRDGNKFSFFHEAFFDYAFARQWINKGETLVAFLLTGEQELFRRGQVRQILAHLREDDAERFVVEIEALLTNPNVRFHIKHLVLAFIRALPAPTVREWEMIERITATSPAYMVQLSFTLREVAWFKRLDTEGVLDRWLSGNSVELQGRAIDVIASATKKVPDRVAALLGPHAGRHNSYPNWLRWIVRSADVSRSRPLFSLLLDAVRRGEYEGREQELWSSVNSLGDKQPVWAVELLVTYFAERPSAFELESGHVPSLGVMEHAATELVSKAASAAPEAFCVQLLPFMLKAMQLTQYEGNTRPIKDRHFSYRHPSGEYGPHSIGDAFLRGAVDAVRRLVQEAPGRVRETLDTLAADPHEASQFILYEALRSDGVRDAEWAVNLLLEGPYRFFSGYIENPVWATRELIKSISTRISDQSFSALEQAVMSLSVPWEAQSPGGAQFCLLSAFDEGRLSEQARRRLVELRCQFGVDQPTAPQGMVGGFVGPPVPDGEAQHLTDDQWLHTMEMYNTDTHDLMTFRGGVREQASVLRSATAADPTRFAQLALRLTGQQHPEYANAILQGLGQTQAVIGPVLVFDTIRHIAALGIQDNDQSLADPLQRLFVEAVPDDVIGLVVDRALHSPDRTEDVWLETDSSGRATYGSDIYANGINTARGHCADVLANLLIHDVDGHRTCLVVDFLDQLASDPSTAVRACVARLLAACLRYARHEAVLAFDRLMEADDRLLASRPVGDLIVYVGNGQPAMIEPVVVRMLHSEFAEVRRGGGGLAAYAGLELGLEHLLTEARTSDDGEIRAGAATVCAHRLANTTNVATAATAITQFLNDSEETVRKSAAEVAAALRGQSLGQFGTVLNALILSPSFTPAVAQLLITLQFSLDRIDSFVLACVRRFIEVFGADAGDISTGAAGEATKVGELLLRAYTQAASEAGRAEALDLIDSLLLSGAYGVERQIDAAQR